MRSFVSRAFALAPLIIILGAFLTPSTPTQDCERCAPKIARAKREGYRAGWDACLRHLRALLSDAEPSQGSEPGDVTDGPQPPAGEVLAPALAEIGPATWHVMPAAVIDPDGMEHAAGQYPLAWAMRRAQPGAVLELDGKHPYTVIIGGGNPNWGRVVIWPDGSAVRELTVIDSDGDATLGGAAFRTGHGGWDGVRFHGIALANPRGSYAPVSVAAGSRGGAIWITGCTFRAAAGNNEYAGHGAKWWIRAHGGCSLYVYDVVWTASAQEHAVYIDNPEHLVVARCAARIPSGAPRFGRTLIQSVSRRESSPAPAEWRGIVLEDVHSEGSVDRSAGGGSVYTIGGYPGTVHLRRVSARGPAEGPPPGGGLAVWAPTNYGGTYVDAHGWPTSRLVLEDVRLDLPRADREAAVIEGVREVELAGVALSGSKPWIAAPGRYGAHLARGQISLRLREGETAPNGLIRSWEGTLAQGRWREWSAGELEARIVRE